MNRKFTHILLSSLVVFSLFAVTLPQAGYAQTAAKGSSQAAELPYASALAAIEQKTEARRKELGIPGMSLAIVKDDQVIFMKGFGYKDFEKQLPVTADTQFAIGSATKAFTALTVLMAQDQGKLSLDDSPKKALSYFKMHDPETDKAITIRDLLSHSSGLNRTDLAMITGKLNRAELIQVAAQAKPTAKLREKFQYQNLMFTAAGEIVAAIEKKPWEKIVPETIFKPLGMTNSNMSIGEMERSKDHSFGYNYNFDTKETKRLPYRAIDEVAPAGSINSSARDMTQWLRFVLNRGELDGKRLVSEKGFDEWIKPQIKISPDGKVAYGLGWFIRDWQGSRVVEHGGNIDGFNSLVAMIPEKKLGFVLLTNVSASSLGSELMPIIWSSFLGEDKPAEAKRATRPAMEKLIGTYNLEAAKLNVEVKIEGEDLFMIVPGQPKYKLERTGDRQYKPIGAPEGFAAKFTPSQGNADQLELIQPNGNFTLKRVAAVVDASSPATSSSAAEIVGEYLAPGGNGTIEVKENDGKVTLNIPGQQPYALIAKAKDSYSLSPLPETYTLRVKRAADAKIESIVISQPEGEFEFKRNTAAKPSITADELMQKAIDAVGGEANLRRINTRVMEADVDLENQGVQAKVVSYAKAPNKTASETTMIALGKTIATGFDYFDGTGGEEVYSFAPAEKYTGKRLEDVRLGSDFYGPLNWKTNYKRVEVKGLGKVGDEEAYIVEFEPEKGTLVKEYYSTKTFLLLKRDGVIASSTSPQQLPYTVTFADYRDVDGVKLPFKVTNYSLSNGNIVSIVTSVKHNVPVDDKLFTTRKVQ